MSYKDMKETQVVVMQRHEGDTSIERTEVERELRWRVVIQRHEGDTSRERTEVERCHTKT